MIVFINIVFQVSLHAFAVSVLSCIDTCDHVDTLVFILYILEQD